MKTAKEIEEMIRREKVLLNTMPKRSQFGDDNHGNILKEIDALEKCLNNIETYGQFAGGHIACLADDEYDDEMGDEAPQTVVYDWVLERSEQEPVEADDYWLKIGEEGK
jgi:5'-deoxynucleotidase YfbR-like HD superfamily hydrolase